METAAKPHQYRDAAVEGHFGFDGPKSAVHGGVAGVGLEDAGDAGVEEVQEGQVADEEATNLKMSGGEGDGEAEQSGEPVAGKDAEGAIGEVLAKRGAAFVAGEDEEAGDREEAFDGDASVEESGEDEKGRVLGEIPGVNEDDGEGQEQANDVEIIRSHRRQ